MKLHALAAPLLALALLGACSTGVQPVPAPVSRPGPAIQPVELSVPSAEGRAVLLRVWTAPDEKGVVVFSHGYGGAPQAYQKLLSEWARHGFTVIAPMHVDSREHPQHDDDGQTAFFSRLTDLGVARGLAATDHPGKPLIVAGHSFGSLMSVIQGGASTRIGPVGDPAVKGVIAFSSAGNLPALITPETYHSLDTPLLVVTGDRDLAPGYADDWRDHRAPFDDSPPGDKTLLVFSGADHQLPGTAEGDRFKALVAATEDFLDAYALNDAAARSRLDAFSAVGVTVERR